MPKFDASSDRVWIQTASPGVFAEIKGQNNLGQPSSRGTIDNGDKQSWPYNTYQPGALETSISIDVIPDYPDVNGYQRVESLYNSGTTEIVQIRRNGSGANGTTDVIWQCVMMISQNSKTYNKGELRKASVVFMPAAKPTVDTMA